LPLIYELRERAQRAGVVSPQDAVRLMNQGAALLDACHRGHAAATSAVRATLPLERLADGLTA
jgi:hypothetical protein